MYDSGNVIHVYVESVINWILLMVRAEMVTNCGLPICVSCRLGFWPTGLLKRLLLKSVGNRLSLMFCTQTHFILWHRRVRRVRGKVVHHRHFTVLIWLYVVVLHTEMHQEWSRCVCVCVCVCVWREVQAITWRTDTPAPWSPFRPYCLHISWH